MAHYEKEPYLSFGEFSPTSNYTNTKFTIDWGDGTKDEITFDLYITWKDYQPTVHSNVSLNGKPHKGWIELVKKGNKGEIPDDTSDPA